MAINKNSRPDEKGKSISFWQESAKNDWKVAGDLFKLKHYNYCLFFCQLTLEKILKALFIKNADKYPLPIHNLVEIVKGAKVKVSLKEKVLLGEITTFNVEARYDVLKKNLYKKATREFTQRFIEITQDFLNKFTKML